MRLWAWQFKNAKTAGVGARIADLEAGRETQGKTDDNDEHPHQVSGPGFEIVLWLCRVKT